MQALPDRDDVSVSPETALAPSSRALAASLSSLFTPRSVALIGATETPGSVGRTLFENLTATFPGAIVVACHRVRNPRLSEHHGGARPGRSCRDRDAGADGPRHRARLRPCRRPIGDRHLRRFQGVRRRRCVARAGYAARSPARTDPDRRTELSRRDEPGERAQRDVRRRPRLRRARRVSEPERRPVHRRTRLEPPRTDRLQRVRVGWRDGRRRLGRLDRASRPRSRDHEHRALHGIDRRRALLCCGGARSRAGQADHRDQGGRTDEAARAAASHTGAIAGRDRVLDAAFAQSGVLRVDSIEELFDMAEVLAKQPRPAGPRLCIVTNAGGPGVLATDALIRQGGQLATLAPETVAALDRCLPSAWSRANPIDILGDADPARYARALSIAAADPGSDGLLVVLTPQAMTDPTSTADCLAAAAAGQVKPVLASWMGGTEVAAGQKRLNDAGIPTLPFPDAAAALFAHMARHSCNLCDLDDVSMIPPPPRRSRAAADAVIGTAQRADRTLLTPFESTHLLAAYGLPMLETRLAPTEEEAVAAAARLGYPVALKLHSHTVRHKSDVGGVRLNLPDEAGVRAGFRAIRDAVSSGAGQDFRGVTVQPMIDREGAFELIVGSSHDPQFGPVVLFGAGGTLVEIEKDYALALAPLTPAFARRMIAGTRISRAFGGVRGRPAVDAAALERILMLVSQCVVNHPRIREIDVNPLLVRGETIVAVDARVVLQPATIGDDALPRPSIESQRCQDL